MSIRAGFETFTEILADHHDLNLINEIENHFKDIWNDEYYETKTMTIAEIKEMGISPLHNTTYDKPYPRQYKTDKKIVVVFDSEKNRGVMMDGNHRFSTAELEKFTGTFDVVIFYIEIPWDF